VSRSPRHDLEGGAPEVPGWLTLRDVALALGVGLVLAAVLTVVTPGAGTHVLGGTDLRETTVAAVREGGVPNDDDKTRTTYDLTWSDGGETRSATFHRAGDPDHAVGDTWRLWVSPDGSVVETTSPRTTLLWLGVGMPAFVLVIGLFVRWRNRTMSKAVLKEADRIGAQRHISG
jgi:hypothetical protein